MKVKYSSSTHRVLFAVLLSLTVASNGSQAAVLCVGSDGHIAIEPAGHDHCADGTHLHASHTMEHGTALAPQAGGGSCRPCTDIPIPAKADEDRSVRRLAKTSAAGPVAVLSGPQAPEGDSASAVASASAVFLICYHVPLRSIVLQV